MTAAASRPSRRDGWRLRAGMRTPRRGRMPALLPGGGCPGDAQRMSTHEPEPTEPVPDRTPPGSAPAPPADEASGGTLDRMEGRLGPARGGRGGPGHLGVRRAVRRRRRQGRPGRPAACGGEGDADGDGDGDSGVERGRRADAAGVRAGPGGPGGDGGVRRRDRAGSRSGDGEGGRGRAGEGRRDGRLDRPRPRSRRTARFEVIRTCLRGTLDAMGTAFEAGGLEAAVQELQKLSGQCSRRGPPDAGSPPSDDGARVPTAVGSPPWNG